METNNIAIKLKEEADMKKKKAQAMKKKALDFTKEALSLEATARTYNIKH